MSNIIIPKESFIKIYSGYLKYLALQRGGVDNWIWYDESLRNFQDKAIAELYNTKDLPDIDDYDFITIAEINIERGIYNIREEKANDI
jgi:hypothetical protein